MNAVQFPKIFTEEDALAIRSQRRSKLSVILIGCLAVSYEILGVIAGAVSESTLFWVPLVLTVLTSGILVRELFASSRTRLEVPWYDARAAAESIKTVYFRYLVQAEPFSQILPREEAELKLRDRIEEVMRGLGKTVGTDAPSGNGNVLDWAWSIRMLPLSQRMNFYISNRILNQLEWYSSKSMLLKRKARQWTIASVVAAVASLVLASVAIFVDSLRGLGSPFLQIAVVTFGYVAIRNYRRDSRAYAVTHAEIEDAYKKLAQVKDDVAWSHSVDEIEEAFSREHVTWRASHSGWADQA
jgi:hypothetical protein